jgi:peptidoglycan hydrolase-like protein with peptidoglycan-binding domain
MTNSWGNPRVPTFRKKYIRPVKSGAWSILIHAALVDMVSEILESVTASGIHLTEEPVGWIPYVDGGSPLEEGRSLYLPGGFPDDAFHDWGFDRVPGFADTFTFPGSADQARELAVKAEVVRSLRCMPALKKPDGSPVTVFPGDREVRLGDYGDDVRAFQMTYACPTQDGECDRATLDLAAYIQRRNGAAVTGTIDEYAWMAVLPTTLNMSQEYGCSGNIVRLLQAVLYCYDWDSELMVSGRYDQQTMSAIQRLQDTYGLRTSGVTGPAEWAILLGKQVRSVY